MIFPGGSQVKNLSTNAGDADYVILCAKIPNLGAVRDVGSIPGSGRSSGEGNDYALQCSCLENPMDRGEGQAIVHGAAKSWP